MAAKPTSILNLIEALTIFSKYGNDGRPTMCEHDALYVLVDPEIVSKEDKILLKKYGFVATDLDNFCSYNYGSA